METFKFAIPEESNGIIIENVSRLRKIEGKLRELLYKENYTETIVPTFEYVELYKSIYKNIDESTLFKYVSKDGKDIDLRWDFTIPIARHYVSQQINKIARYCYFGKIYRKERQHKGKSSEIYQAGFELIGKKGIEGEIESLSIMQKSLPIFGLKDLKIELGSASLYKRLCELVGDKEIFSNLILQKNISGLKNFVEERNIEQRLGEFIVKLPRLNGDINMLIQIMSTIHDKELLDSMNELKTLYEKMNMKNQDLFDLAFVPNMEYYTGIVFKVYSQYSSEAIISGGRYDALYGSFGKETPAIGMAYYLDNILKAIERAGEKNG